jgi:hypothetical protein
LLAELHVSVALTRVIITCCQNIFDPIHMLSKAAKEIDVIAPIGHNPGWEFTTVDILGV